MVTIWLFALLPAILYVQVIMYVGLFGHSAVVFHVFNVLLTVCVAVFYQWHFIDLFTCLINLLGYLLIGPMNTNAADLTTVTAENSTFSTTRYDTRCYFNVRSKADMSQLNLPHGTDN